MAPSPFPSSRINFGLLFLSILGLCINAVASVTPMPIISHAAPVFASGTASGNLMAAANDTSESSLWASNAIPAWIAYDLSAVPVSERDQVVVAWYAPLAVNYINAAPISASSEIPLDYTIEGNVAAGG